MLLAGKDWKDFQSCLFLSLVKYVTPIIFSSASVFLSKRVSELLSVLTAVAGRVSIILEIITIN
jgi:hypothetical protein